MTFKGPYCYTLFLSDRKTKRVIQKCVVNGVEVKFEKPVTRSRVPKLYILKSADRVVYIGYTSQSMGTRLSGGLKASGEQGYHGYQWKYYRRINLMVFCFPAFTGVAADDLKLQHFVTAVEAELAYLVRSNTGHWPECQNEVHFSNRSRKKVLKVSNEIYDIIDGR